MKYVCLGLYDEAAFAQMSKADAQKMFDECFAYDDVLRRGGHFVGGEALDSARNAVTLRMKNGEVQVTDGPYVETKETLGGILLLEARDLNHAISLMSKHPALKVGNAFEIRPANEAMNRLIAERSAAVAKETELGCNSPDDYQPFVTVDTATEFGPEKKRKVSNMKTAALIFTVLLSTAVSAQAQKPTTGYAPVNGLKMYYEIHGKGDGEPLVLLHGSFMTISNNWPQWLPELSKTRKVIAVEMQGHGRTADIDRDINYENLADDIAAMLEHLKIKQADLLGYSMGGGVAMQVAIRHPEKVRKVVSVSAVFRQDGWVKEALEIFPQLTADAFKGSPIEAEYKKLSPTPNDFPKFVKHVMAGDSKPFDFGADKFKSTKAPFLFIHGDADGVRLDHFSEMFRLKGGDISGDLGPRSDTRLAVLPNTTHVTLMEKSSVIIPMVSDFLDAKSQKK